MDTNKIPQWVRSFKNGGNGIHIKPENKGKFTRSAKAAGESVQEHAHKVVNNPNATTLQKRRAQFALNAAKWSHKKKKHCNGGKIPNWFLNHE